MLPLVGGGGEGGEGGRGGGRGGGGDLELITRTPYLGYGEKVDRS